MCRSFLPKYVNKDGEEELYGRLNLGVVSLNLPRVALESNGSKKQFWEILDERLDVAHEGLQYRIERVKQTKPENAPILYMEGAIGRLNEDDDVDVLFKDGRATVSLGYIGVYEAVSVFYGQHWQANNEDAINFAHDMVQYLSDKTKEWREQEGYWYSLYSTPKNKLLGAYTVMYNEKIA